MLCEKEKKNIIAGLIEKYDIQSAEDIQDALKDLLGGTIENMLKSELDNHFVYSPYERAESSNSRSGRKPKMVRSKYRSSYPPSPLCKIAVSKM